MPSVLSQYLQNYIKAYQRASKIPDLSQYDKVFDARKILLQKTLEWDEASGATSESSFILGILAIEDETASAPDIDKAIEHLGKTYAFGDVEAGIALYMIAEGHYDFISADRVAHIDLSKVVDQALAINHPHIHYIDGLYHVNLSDRDDLSDPEKKEHDLRAQEHLNRLREKNYLGVYALEALYNEVGPGVKSAALATKNYEDGLRQGEVTGIFAIRVMCFMQRRCARWLLMVKNKDPERSMTLLYASALMYPRTTKMFMHDSNIEILAEWQERFDTIFNGIVLLDKAVPKPNSPMSYFTDMPSKENKAEKDLADRTRNGISIREAGGGFWTVSAEDDENPYKPVVRLRIAYPDEAKTAMREKISAMENIDNSLIEELMAPLDKMVGLGDIKQDIKDIVTLAFINKKRREMGLKSRNPGMHMVFSGNPGTGKTHVARLVSQILYQLGLLDTGHVVEAHKPDLVGEYQGWSEAKTNIVCQAAFGGVLFIDEAYSLIEDSWGGDFGADVIAPLMKLMEDYSENFIVIAAGYKDKMEDFVKANPGLRSRFSQKIDFRDYTAEEMAEIFKIFATDYDYTLADGTGEKVLTYLKSIKGVHKDRFANARGVRNMFDETLLRKSARLVREGKMDRESLTMIVPEDIPVSEILHDGPLAYLPNKKT